MEHFFITFGDLAASVYKASCEKKQTQTNGGENAARATVGFLRLSSFLGQIPVNL